MTTVFDVPADRYIRSLAEELKKKPEITPPEWSLFAKTGVHKEMPPEDPIGVERMRTFYGGGKDRGSRPTQFRKGSGSILRKSLQQLEAAGLIIHDKTGRRVSPQGMSFMDNLARSLVQQAEKTA